ncbi:monocarboxylate transporter 12 isoform X2 [Patella vulgata]|uniref:monocarboxylate transporter 12 isoform X2 n=1 Tax=Patella vulgata TaxID=6465 RepID=UPI00217FC5B6|nr:monocarboxylate transporter 12 isoform X2 [Patella vulgata]
MIVVTVKRKNSMPETGAGSWLVVLAAFFSQFIICGITYSLGVFHVVFRDHFSATHFDASWTGSILLYVTALSSIMLRFVTSYWGCRVSVMLGGILAATGLGLGMVVTELYQVYLTYGLLTGIGFGLACSPSIVAVEKCFVAGRVSALSVVVGGIGAGIITFPVIIRFLLEQYAWKGTMLILAGVALNLCVCGALMKSNPDDKEVRLLPLLSCLPLRHPLFHGMCIANLFWSFGSTVIYMYLPSYAMAKGTDFESAIFLISCIGMASFTSRMIFAFMGHNSTLDSITSIICPIGIGVVITGIFPLLFKDFAGQLGYTLLFGFYTGFWTTFLSQVSRELLGPEYIALGNGYLSFMIALGSLAAGPATAMLVQEENEFKYAFYLAGACLLWSSVIMVLFKFKKCGALDKPTAQDVKVPLIAEEVVQAPESDACSEHGDTEHRDAEREKEKSNLQWYDENLIVEAVITSV